MYRNEMVLLKKTNCPEPYIIVGHSIAGVMLREFIYENSNSISGIVFVDVSHPDLRGNMSDELKEYIEFGKEKRIKEIESQDEDVDTVMNAIVNREKTEYQFDR